MKILNWLKKKKKNKKKYTDDEYIKSQLISYFRHGNEHVFYILFTFSNSYCQSAIDIVNYLSSKAIYIPSSDDIDTGEFDEDGNEIINSIPKNYLLIEVSYNDIKTIIGNTDISNSFVYEIIQIMYKYGRKIEFEDNLISDDIMNESLFITENGEYSDNIIHYSGHHDIFYVDIEAVLKVLPSEFTGADLFDIFSFAYVDIQTSIMHQVKLYDGFKYISDDDVAVVYKGVLKNPTRDNLQKLLLPKYKRSIDEDELIHGDLSSSNVDDLFKEKYERFNAIKNNNTEYMDIDEALSEDDPEYNDLQSDDVEEY